MFSPISKLATLALMSALLAPAVLRAQISEDFNDITTLSSAGWVLKNNSAPAGVIGWFEGNSTVFPAYNGPATSYIGANFNNTTGAGNISNWLMTPLQTLTNGSVFSFYTRGEKNQFADRLELRMSTAGASSDVGGTDASVGDFGTLLLSVNPSLARDGFPIEWTQYSATVSGLSGATTGRFALRYFVTDGGPSGANSDYIGIDAVRYTVNEVPEPASLALVATGLAGLGVASRRRRRA